MDQVRSLVLIAHLCFTVSQTFNGAYCDSLFLNSYDRGDRGRNRSPVIGILTLPAVDNFRGSTPKNGRENVTSPSVLPASYVKFLEAAGARVVPVLVAKDEDYYKKIMSITNGLLFTGGSTNLQESVFTESAYTIFKHAKELNDQGDYYPLWGTCQGFEFLIYAANDIAYWPFEKCNDENKVRSTRFFDQSHLRRTRMFQDAPDLIIELVSNEPTLYFDHSWCLPPAYVVNQPTTQNFYNEIAEAVSEENIKFITIVEGKRYPFYGVQFHPEKPAWEPSAAPDRSNTPHTPEAVLVGQYFANFFVREARKSPHVYPNTNESRSRLIYNYCPAYDGIDPDATNVQNYYFN